MENKEYELDLHNTLLLEEYRSRLPEFVMLRHAVMQQLENFVSEVDIELNQMESRIKAEPSLVGKLQRKGHKYSSLSDITDILGVRIIAYYNEDVDRIASMAEKYFDIDWPNSVDKRKMHQFDSFGYNSLHYICKMPRSLYFDPEHPELNDISFELQKLPVFPKVENCRSMLYVGNLVEFIRLVIKNEEEGIFFPQNAQYSNTSRLVQMIAEAHGKRVVLVGGCTVPLALLSQATGLVNKAFGSLAYEMSMSDYKEDYRKYSLEESIRLTEG